jgi:hypothetical protein
MPLDLIKPRPWPCSMKHAPSTAAKAGVAVFQSLAQHDPDVDGIYRLTQGTPFYFGKYGVKLVKEAASWSLALRPGLLAPYNAQATLHVKAGLWALLLPVTVSTGKLQYHVLGSGFDVLVSPVLTMIACDYVQVHGRVSDIWRGYAAQRLMWDTGHSLAFTPPLVTQAG